MPRQDANQIIEVAEQILADIRERKLQPGENYLSTAETARKLKISGSTVNRAFQLLARRGVVERRQRRGTIVLDPHHERPTQLEQVLIMMREDRLQSEGTWGHRVLLGIQRSLPGVELKFHFHPMTDEADEIQSLVHELLRSRTTTGLILIRAGVVLQRMIQASGLPAVVNGTLHPSIRKLPSIDRDQQQIGRLLAEHLLKKRCRKFLILMRERIAAGDHLMLDAALQTLSQAEVPLQDISLRFLPSDDEAIQVEVLEQLRRLGRGVGCLCRSERLAQGVTAAVEQTQEKISAPTAIVVADFAPQGTEETTYPCIESEIDQEELGSRIGRLLLASARGELGTEVHEIVPVRLVGVRDRSGRG